MGVTTVVSNERVLNSHETLNVSEEKILHQLLTELDIEHILD